MGDDFHPAALDAIEEQTQRVGLHLFERIEPPRLHILQRRWWDEQLMDWAMQDEALKVQMFRFVDVLPMLGDGQAVAQHLHEYLHVVRDRLPRAVRTGLSLAGRNGWPGRLLAAAARWQITGQARRFIAGTNAREVLQSVWDQRQMRRAFTLALLGETVTSQHEADRYLDANRQLLEDMAPQVNAWPAIPQIDTDDRGPLPRMNLSVKLTALDSQFDGLDHEGSFQRVAPRLRQLLRAAAAHGALINVDMENYATKHLTLDIFRRLLMEDEFRNFADVGIVLQAYLKDSWDDLRALRDWARQRGTPVWVRLVKGAYWDYESVHAWAEGWPVPVYEQKYQTDENFERCTRLLLHSADTLRPAIASHNLRSLAHAIAVADHLGLPRNGYELQMLYGMGDPEKDVLVDLGLRLRIYMPMGELIPGMAYLVRRLLENTSNDSFLRASVSEHAEPRKLLMNPRVLRESAQRGNGSAGWIELGTHGQVHFRNEPHTDFNLADNRRAMAEALDLVREQFGHVYPLWIADRAVETDETLVSENPSHKRQVVGAAAMAEQVHVEEAVTAAVQAWPAWQELGFARRAEYLRRAAQQMRRRRFELAAWIVHECGKPWRDADADVAEAIDFCEYYAACGERLAQPGGVDVPGEENRFEYLPRGVAAIIAPWNFPLAILTGMTTAALVAGNPAIMKPAEQSPVVAAKLMEIFRECDFPPGVVQYLPGQGETVGAALVEHPRVAVIAFTGSMEVGLHIHRRAAECSAEQRRFVKRVIAEMGGKNAILVDADADLDEAVLGVVASAFGYQGQKCSACSRVVVLQEVYEPFLDRLIEAARSLTVAPAEEPGCRVGPLIDQDALTRVRRYIDLGRAEAREVLAVDVGPLADEGYYVGPHIFAGVHPEARLAQEEIFGPVLSVLRAKDFDEALRIANGTRYALTGGIFSRSPANVARARRELMVGNLYINRGITGALVGRQPFGGFRMSGIGSKAGGPDYLLQFMVPRTVTENTLRRGFAPAVAADVSWMDLGQ